MYLCVVISAKLYVTGSHHLYIIIAVALAAPATIAIIVLLLMAIHRQRWLSWRKRSLATHMSKMSTSPVAVHQQLLTSQLLEQSLQPRDEHWEIDPALYVKQYTP